MFWILIGGVIPALLWSVVNHLDKFLLSYKKGMHSSVDVLMVYTAGFSLIVLPVLFLLAPRGELFLGVIPIAISILGGVLMAFSFYFYLSALERDEASVVMPLGLLLPLFAYFFSYLFLGEVLTPLQLGACGLVLLGALFLTLEFEGKKVVRLKYAALFYALGFTSFQGLQETLFKMVALEHSFWVSLFWLHAGILLFGVGLLLVYPTLPRVFFSSVRRDGRVFFFINVASESISTFGYLLVNYALMFVPVAIIGTFNSFQPAFVFLIGTMLTIFAPHLAKEKISRHALLQKSVSIIIMIAGAVLISQTV